MFTITATDFARLEEARRLQVERYRTAYFKREGTLPPDTDCALEREWLRVVVGEQDCCLPIGTLTKWGKTFGETAPLSISINGKVTVKRGTSSISLFTLPVETGKGFHFRSGCTTALDAPIPLTVTNGALIPELPDLSAELATLRAETTANRKQVNREKAIAKARKIEREALDTLAKASGEASEAKAIVDGMTLKQAVSHARACLNARRLLHSTFANVGTLPAWLPLTFQESVYEWDETKGEHADKVSTLDTLPAWREYANPYQTARAALEEYKPRLQWPSYVESLASEAGLSVATYKRANPDRARPIYGPTFDKLKESERKALDKLKIFTRARFREYLTAQGLPDCLASEYGWQVEQARAYSRARLLLSTWEQRRADLESRAFEATKAREGAEA